MYIKCLGALLVMGSCAVAGFQIAARHRKETSLLNQIITVMDFMECELLYRHTPLPALCRQTAGHTSGMLRGIFLALSEELDKRVAPSASTCMKSVLSRYEKLPVRVKELMTQFGDTLGIFDLDGQITGLRAVKQECHMKLKLNQENQEERMRSYQTLGVCAGAGLAIILI